MMPKFAGVRWQKHVTKATRGAAFGVEYIAPIDTGLCLWDTLEVKFFRWTLRVNRFRLFH